MMLVWVPTGIRKRDESRRSWKEDREEDMYDETEERTEEAVMTQASGVQDG